jgi:uncharacterized integral membrane protein (TIGR00698 family)
MEKVKKRFAGVLICAFVSAAAGWLSKLHIGSFSLQVVGAPVFAILIGMAASMAFPKLPGSDALHDGIRFTSKKVLQWAVVILGFSLDIGTIARVGGKSLPVILSTISVSLIVAFLMMKALRMDSKVAALIGIGSSICGGSAIAAAAPVIEADDSEVAQAISVIFLFNVMAALIFPTLGHAIGFGTEGFAVFAGTAVNDTSSVTAAASTAESIYGADGILSAAVTVKLTRTLAIIPITLVLALSRAVKAKKTGKAGAGISMRKVFPFFILFFAAAAVVTTAVGIMPDSRFTAFYSMMFVPSMKWLAKFFIAMAMCAIGLNTNLPELIKKGGKPIFTGFCCWAAITAVSIGVQLLTGVFYTDL